MILGVDRAKPAAGQNIPARVDSCLTTTPGPERNKLEGISGRVQLGSWSQVRRAWRPPLAKDQEVPGIMCPTRRSR